MAKKEKINVLGRDFTLTEKKVYDALDKYGKMNYKQVAEVCDINPNSAKGVLARMDTKHGLAHKNEGKKGTFYKVNKEAIESKDLSKLTEKEKNVLNIAKNIEGEFNYKDVQIENMTTKAIIATIARLESAYGVFDKITTNTLASYELKKEN